MTSLALDRPFPPQPASAATATCAHCGETTAPGQRFCCSGCAAAYDIVQELGLGTYYERREFDDTTRKPRPQTGLPGQERHDLTRHIHTTANGTHELTLAVDGLQCGACVWLIESVLAREPAVTNARINMTTRRLRLAWQGAAEEATRLVTRIEALGYRLIPFDARALAAACDATETRLLRAMAVAGFAAGNVMLLSLGIWWGLGETMGPATRALMHWVSALLALPAIAYAGMPFFTAAIAALRQGRTNMDVPISIGVILVTGMSLAETMRGGMHAYFDSAAALLFFLLIGRVLDARARGAARATAEQLLALRASDVTIRDETGATRRVPAETLAPGARLLVGMGERIGADGILTTGETQLDTSLVSGESTPTTARAGERLFAGTVNLGAPIEVQVTATGAGTLLAECARLIAAAEEKRGRYVVLADRIARAYAPVVHSLALLTFLGWLWLADAPWQEALLTATAVLIITCPCALALAVPAAQVIATQRLFRAGILLKSATALERLASVDHVIFDKTGTLTLPTLGLSGTHDPDALHTAAALAAASRHPLARALTDAAGVTEASENVTEHPGQGLLWPSPDGEVRLGSRSFCGIQAVPADGPELWLTRPGHSPYRFSFAETPRPDAHAVIDTLRAWNLPARILSGDQPPAVSAIAEHLGIADYQANLTPPQKVAAIEALTQAGHHVLMVGDGLNDGPALAAATVSASPASAADISQNAADIVFQGDSLSPITEIIATARQAGRVMRQNLAFSLGYNAILIPVAMAGLVTPWLAAAAMSASSLIVIANSFRLNGRKRA